MPGAATSSSRARSGERSRRVCTLTASEWPLTTGTRTQVARDADLRIAEDLARLVHQLALLVGVVLAIGERAGMGKRR